MSTLVIGYGNELCGDDGLGPEIAARLQQIFVKTSNKALEIVAMCQLDVVLGERISHYQRVIFIDAQTQLYQEPVVIQQLQPVSRQNSDKAPSLSTHQLHPLEILELAQRLYDSKPEAWLVAVRGHQMELGTPIGQAALENAGLAVSAICALLAEFNILPD